MTTHPIDYQPFYQAFLAKTIRYEQAAIARGDTEYAELHRDVRETIEIVMDHEPVAEEEPACQFQTYQNS